MTTYGTTSNPSHNRQSQSTPLLPSIQQPPQPTKTQRLKSHFRTPISSANTDLPLLYSYTITGLLDSSATSIWGSFVSMQTGNTIYFAQGIAALFPSSSNLSSSLSSLSLSKLATTTATTILSTDNTRWIKAGTSIASFCVGSFIFSRFHRHFGPKKRWVLTLSFVVQTLLIAVAAGIVMVTEDTGPGSGFNVNFNHDTHWHVLLPLSLIAFQSSAQAVTSRALKHNSLTTVVLTSTYCDLFSDAELFAGLANRERNRRVMAPVLVLVGAVLGGWLAGRGADGIVGALWTAVGLKVVVVLAWIFWKGEENGDE